MQRTVQIYEMQDPEGVLKVSKPLTLTQGGSLIQSQEDEGFEGGGYDWGSLAAIFLAEKMPELVDIVHFDPEASMFCAYSDNSEEMQRFVHGFKDACEDDDSIRDLFSRAELD
ncbi:hypothetical protein D3C73_924100 [compost metagenome]